MKFFFQEKAYLYFPIAVQTQAAKVLNQHIKDYGIDPAIQLDQETGLPTNFVNNLSTKYTEQSQPSDCKVS